MGSGLAEGCIYRLRGDGGRTRQLKLQTQKMRMKFSVDLFRALTPTCTQLPPSLIHLPIVDYTLEFSCQAMAAATLLPMSRFVAEVGVHEGLRWRTWLTVAIGPRGRVWRGCRCSDLRPADGVGSRDLGMLSYTTGTKEQARGAMDGVVVTVRAASRAMHPRDDGSLLLTLSTGRSSCKVSSHK